MAIKTPLENQIKNTPDAPGVYIFEDAQGQVLYIGKAINLKKRVLSYFHKKAGGKTRVLVKKISEIRYMVVDSESDALLLENNLIKKYQPRYNVLLKDDKTFPWICIKNEPFPRVFSTRNKINDGSEYHGPYTSMVMVRTLLDLVRQLYPLRNCSLNLSPGNIHKGKYKVCLEYHIGRCKAPCVGKQDEKDYQDSIDHIRHILKGNIFSVQKVLRKMMEQQAAEYRFEEANIIKEKIDKLQKFQSKSTMVSSRIKNMDVCTVLEDAAVLYVNYLRILNGAVIQTHSMELRKRLDESKQELMLTAITEFRQRFESDAREIVVPFDPGMQIHQVRWIIPKRGERKELLDLSLRNLRYFKLERQKRKEAFKKRRGSQNLLEMARNDLRMKDIPSHIECFDNSNLHGSNPTASCVVFRQGKPSPKEYRHYNIKSITGINDVASMEEIVFRRYKRQMQEGKGLPDAIIVDGGKGQLNAAVRSLAKLKLRGTIAVFGIAKRLEEIYVPGDPVPLYLDKNAPTLKMLQHIRNEAHRFGKSLHEKKRSQEFLESELMNVPGIGARTMETLLRKYKSLPRLKKAPPEELNKLIGPSRTEKLRHHLRNSSI
jgi:excinuclease ABC subunit C